MRKLLLLTLFTLAAAVTYAGGYRVSLQGQRALAMGHTGVAVVNSAELGFFNPSGLVYLENKINVAAGISAVFSDVVWQNQEFGQVARTETPVGTPFYFYASYRLNNTFTLGLNVYTPYGSSVKWAKDWPGSHLVNNIELTAMYVQPVASVKLSQYLSIGGGPIFVTGSVNFNRNLTRTMADIDGNRSNVTVDAGGVTAWGWSGSAMFSPTEQLRIGFNYRSEIIIDAKDGDAIFENIPNSPLTPFENTSFNASLPLPAELTFGFSYKLLDTWVFAFDYNQTFWSVYQSLDIDFSNPNIPDSENARNYEDSSIYRLGVQYDASDEFTLRLGYYFDESPVQAGYFAPETPRNDSHGFTGGLSLNLNDHFAIDVSFLYIRFEELEASYDFYFENGQAAPFEGTYKSSAFVPGLGITYKL